jgi:hypothetical protein
MKCLFTENHPQARQDKYRSIAFAACTDAATAHTALDDDFKLLVHAGDAMEEDILDCEGNHL